MRLTVIALAVALPVAAQVFGTGGAPGGGGGGGRGVPRTAGMQPPEMKPGKGSIEGTVTNSVTHQPIKKATVLLYGFSQLQAVTDEAGHFAFKQLPQGTFTLQAQSSAFPPQMGPPKMAPVILNADEAKTGINLTLTPGGTINGRIVDEEANPMAGCNVAAMDIDATSGTKRLATRASSNSDDRGEFHIINVPKGKYYVMARCFSNIPLPHAFVRRGPQTEIPTLAYEPMLYPSATDLAGATTVVVAPGSEVSGIDFRLSPAAGATVRGHVGSNDPDGLRRFVQLMLSPADPLLRDVQGKNAPVNRQTGTFRFEHVMPGRYDLVAISRGPDGMSMARTPLVVGTSDPQAVELLVEPSPSVKGTVVIEGDAKQPTDNMQVSLQPRGGEAIYGPPPQAMVQKDGTFVLPNVTPAKWAIFVSAMNGFVKSVAVAGQESPGDIVDFTSGVSGPLKVTISSKWAQVTGTVTGLPAEQQTNLNGVMWPADEPSPTNRGFRMFGVQPDGRFTVPNLSPGQFYVCVLPMTDAWSLLRNTQVLEQLRNRCSSVELKEGEASTVQVAFLPEDDLHRIVDDSDR